jgi:hypothetical protein
MNDAYSLLTYADDVNLIGGDIRTIEKMQLNAYKILVWL